MKASILTIGDEILNGTTVDTNSSFIAKTCVANGIGIVSSFSIADAYDSIYGGLDMAKQNADIIFITGGLGPTKDDITKQALANYFDTSLVFNELVLKKIEDYFKNRGQKQIDLNRKLALIPKCASLIANEKGTAFGMWFEIDGKVFISMPGVPHEMKNMLTKSVLPKLQSLFQLPTIVNRYIMCAGIGESAIYEKIEDIEALLPKDVSLAYLPNLGFVKLRLTRIVQKGDDEKIEELEAFQQKIVQRIAYYVYSLDDRNSLSEIVGGLLLKRNETISTAESCTGGYISHLITKTPGSSAYYEGSVIAYSYEIKKEQLGVNESTLVETGAVSEETVREMITGLLATTRTTYGISVSGIAGPGGGTPDKPVGTVWIAVGNKDSVIAKKFQLTKERSYNIQISAMIALNLLRNFILDKEIK